MTPQQTAALRFRNLLGQGFDGSTIGFASQQFEFLLYPGKEAELLRRTQQDARLYTAVNCLFNEERRASDPHLLDRVPIPQPAMPGPKPLIKITRHAPKTGTGQDSRVFEGVPAALNSHANNPHPKIDPAQLDGAIQRGLAADNGGHRGGRNARPAPQVDIRDTAPVICRGFLFVRCVMPRGPKGERRVARRSPRQPAALPRPRSFQVR
jgi:hypothetical protein